MANDGKIKRPFLGKEPIQRNSQKMWAKDETEEGTVKSAIEYQKM